MRRSPAATSRAPRHSGSPLVAVDVVIFSIAGTALQALLVEVKNGAVAGRWAFPGGRVPAGEAPEAAAARELRQQTGIADVYLEQLRTFGDPRRDPQAHVVSIAYFALIPRRGEELAVPPAAKYARCAWFDVDALPPLAYDHTAIAACALQRLRAKLEYTNIVYSLMPPEFTLSELQEVYEIILGRRLDRRNFRKKLHALGLLKALRRQRRGAHRPAQLFAFTRRQPMMIQMLAG